ncbi:MAG: DNA repair protein RadC [Nitrospiraceae bacterium]|nr:DNA repair protein RadC [Nitrospiraceae bacterium]
MEGNNNKKQSQSAHYLMHRKRLRERFRQTAFDGFQPYEALELLLTYAIPRKDVKPLAKELIDKFGSFQGVLDAPFGKIMQVGGMGENAATFLTVVKASASLYLKQNMRKDNLISGTMALLDYCRVEMQGLKDEQFRTIFLNSQNEVIADEIIHEGTVDQSVVYPRKVMERALHYKASSMIFVHNHPGGSLSPSKDDIILTEALKQAARSLQIKVHDHLIISKKGYYSFLESGLM